MYTGLTNLGLNSIGNTFSPANLFTNNEQGYWYDSSDLSSMYQESTGITPVYAPGQGSVDCPVGLRLDKRFGLARGANSVVNGTFDTDASGWSATNSGVLSVVSGRLRVTNGAANFGGATQAQVTVIGMTYRVSIEKTLGTGGGSLLIGTSSGGQEIANTSNSVHTFVATSATTYITLLVSDATLGHYTDFDNVVCQSIPGNHASQPTAGSRPTLSARYNLLLATAALSTQSVTTVAASYKLSFTGTGTVTLSGTSPAGPLVGTGANDRVALTFTPTAGTLTLTVSGSVTLADLRLSADAALAIPAYQSVTSATTYDTAGFPWYLKCDGFDDGMVTNTIDFTGTDKMTVFAGITKLSDAAAATFMELGTSQADVAGSFALNPGDYATATGAYWTHGARGAAVLNSNQYATSPAVFAAPISNVLCGQSDIVGDLSTLRVNGVLQASATGDKGAGNFSSNPIYLYRHGGSTSPFLGRDYGQIIRGASSSTAQIAQTELYLRNKMGITF